MDPDLETFGENSLNVQVTVSTGGVSGVEYSTIVRIDDYHQKVPATQKLKTITELLRAALPFQELKGEEKEFARIDVLALDKIGNPLTKETAVKLAQESLKDALKSDDKKQEK